PYGLSIGGFGPFFSGAGEKGVAIFGEDPALFDESVEGLSVAMEVVVLALVSLGYRRAGGVGALAVLRSVWERNPRDFKRDSFGGCSDGGIAKIPSGDSGE